RPRSSPGLEVPRPSSRSPRPPAPPRVQTPYEEGLRALRGGLEAPIGPGGGYAPDDDGEDTLREVELPEAATPVATRLKLALGAIAVGSVAQQLLTTWLGSEQVLEAFGARQPLLSELHRLVTAASIHGGPAHALSNAAFGLVFGVVLFGTHRVGATAWVWLLSSAVGLAAEVSLSPGVVVIGASAGNYGLVGLWTRGQLQRAELAVLPRREVLKTWGVILLLLPGALTPFSSTGSRIAVLAHVVGFLTGLALGAHYRRRLLPAGFDTITRRSLAAGVSALVVTVAAWSLGLLRL
ncbi:MAG: rhomboid family intramembrane serine protease, partial [Myxococcota bacterium]